MNESLQDRIRRLKTDVRLSMDGVVAAGMRDGGITYKYNFGVKLPILKRIAVSYAPDVELARTIRDDDFREMQLIAPMIFDPKELSFEEAWEWVGSINRVEIADNLIANLLEKVPFASDFSCACAQSEESIICYIGFVLAARLQTQGVPFLGEQESFLENRALNVWATKESPERLGALLFLKRLGRKSKNKAEEILSQVKAIQDVNDLYQKADVADLSFEFEFYYEEQMGN